MTNYSRTVIPGRPKAGSRDLDRLVFGDSAPAAANDDPQADDGFAGSDDDDLPPIRPFVDRAPRDRRASQGRRREDYSPLPGDGGFRPREESRRGPLFLIAAAIAVLVFGAVVWNAYREGVRTDEAAAPRLADAGPFKIRPEPAESTRAEPIEASVFERFESPAQSDASATPAPAPDNRPEPAAAAATPAAEAAPAVPAAPKPVAQSAPAAVQPPAPESEPESGPLDGAAAAEFASGGRYLVQIGASTTEAGAEQEWSRWAAKGGGIFDGAEKIIVRADVGGRTVYRVRVGSFATAEDADGFCAAFKDKGGDCFRATR